MIDPVVLSLLDATQSAGGVGSVPEIAGTKTTNPQAGELSFIDAVSQAGTSAISDLRQAEAVSMNTLRGDAGPRELAEAVMEAEKSLQIAIAVRDRIVNAYMEISRMAI